MTDDNLAVEEQDAPETPGAEELSEEEQAKAKLKAAIDVQTEDIGSMRLKVSITIPRSHLDERLDEQFAELKRDSDIPGFRKGHAPMRLVEKRFGSDVGNQLKGQLVSSAFVAATEKENINALGDPLFWINVPDKNAEKGTSLTLLPFETARDHFELPKEGDLTFACEVELKPEFDLPELAGIPLEKPILTTTDDDIDQELKRIQMMRGTFKPVEGGKIEPDDMVYADIKGTVDGEEFLSEENFDLAARDIRVKGIPMTGFGDAIHSKQAGDELTFEATIPDDFEKEDHRGKTAAFHLKILEIKRLSVPDVDDEFLASIGFDSEDELREAMRSNIDNQVEKTLKRAMHAKIGDYLIEQTKLDIPAGLSDRQTERTIARRGIEMLQAGTPESEVQKSLDALRGEARDQVVKDLKLFFILEKIAEEKEIEVRDEHFNAAIADIAQRSGKRFDRVRDDLSKGDGLTHLYMQLRDGQVLDQLYAEAKITEIQRPQPDPAKKKAEPKKKASKKASSQKVTKEKTAKKSTAAPPKEAPKAVAKKSAKKAVKKKTKKSSS